MAQAEFVRFLEVAEVFLCPTTLLPPFDAELRYPHTHAAEPAPTAAAGSGRGDGGGGGGGGVAMGDYLEWMLPCSLLSLTGLPCVSVPVGFTAAGLPIGVQVQRLPQPTNPKT